MTSDPIGDIILREGGYANNPNDSGGPTNFGITQATLSSYLGRPATIDDVQNLTEDTARTIYTNTYLNAPRINGLPEPPQNQVLDMAVNEGISAAIRILQGVLGLTRDGVIGSQTILACSSADPTQLNNSLVAARIRAYQAIVAAHPQDQEFLQGWINRANTFLI